MVGNVAPIAEVPELTVVILILVTEIETLTHVRGFCCQGDTTRQTQQNGSIIGKRATQKEMVS